VWSDSAPAASDNRSKFETLQAAGCRYMPFGYQLSVSQAIELLLIDQLLEIAA
jgi:hypothetical protein